MAKKTTAAADDTTDITRISRQVKLAYSAYPDEPQIPKRMQGYTPFGNYDKIFDIVKSGLYHPTWLYGLPGCGKTAAVIEACARAGRELIRCNITSETNQDDLLGGFRLAVRPDGDNPNPESLFTYGPVVEAMRRGAVLLLDEVDLGTTKLMCLQPVLETSRSVFLKSIHENITAKDGFTIFMTSNTKGTGSHNGAYQGANVMNKALLDRVAMTLECQYPDQMVEVELLKEKAKQMGLLDDYMEDFIVNLVEWADKSRDQYIKSDETTDFISMRRLEMILCNYRFTKNRVEAIRDAVSLQDTATIAGYIQAYRACDPNADLTNDGKSKKGFKSKRNSKFEVDPTVEDIFAG